MITNTIYEIMVYINLNLFEDITLDVLSDKFSYSKYHLHRKFKEIAGITLNEYIRRRRIESSLYFLFANIDTDISEIADYCGYSSATYSREFKKVFNRTPKEWRNIYKKGMGFQKESNICKNYERFIDYSDLGIPKEIKAINIVDTKPQHLSARVFYGNYYSNQVKCIWDDVKRLHPEGKAFIVVPLNSPAVTDPNNCLYVLGFECDDVIPGWSRIIIDEGSYIKVNYRGLRSKLSEAYTWILKFYVPKKRLKYDYRVQFQEYAAAPDLSHDEIECQLYIPICHA